MYCNKPRVNVNEMIQEKPLCSTQGVQVCLRTTDATACVRRLLLTRAQEPLLSVLRHSTAYNLSP